MQPAPLRTSSPFTRPTHMRRTPPMGNMQQQAFARVLLKCFKGVIIGQSGHWAACVPRASIPQMFATSRSHLTADPKLTDGHQVVQIDARHAGRVSMSYVRRGTTKHVMNVRSGPPPTPKPNKMHRNVDTSVRCTEIADIGLRSARARPGGGAWHPGGTSGAAGHLPAHPRPAHPRGAPHATSYAARRREQPRTRGPATPRTLRVLSRLQLPPGATWGSQDTRAGPSVHFIDQNQHPSSQGQLPCTRPLRHGARCRHQSAGAAVGCAGHSVDTWRTTAGQ